MEILPLGVALRLYVLSKDVSPGPYVTLSHCWGHASFMKLTSSNLNDLREGFSIHQLPRTFRDAIIITQRLGVRYLWIDSLCIIQDSKEDWLQEGGRMADVYTHALCNIAASGAYDSDGGCFMGRDASAASGSVFESSWNDMENNTFHIAQKWLWDEVVEDAPLYRRAWVLQERLLAPRILHFGRTQLAFECRELRACETFPIGLPFMATVRKNIKSRLGLNRSMDGEIPGQYDQVEHMRSVWYDVIKAYTACALSKPHDKLIAMSGLVKIIRRGLQDHYLAGLWKAALPTQLLWHVRGAELADCLPSCRPQVYRAPSWSWAAVDGRIMPGSLTTNDECILITINEAHTEPVSQGDETSQVKSGFIRLLGVLIPAEINNQGTPYFLSINRKELLNLYGGGHCTIHADVMDEPITGPAFCLPISSAVGPFKLPGGMSDTNTDPTTTTDCLVRMVSGLILHKYNTAQNTFERWGYFRLSQAPCEYLTMTVSDVTRCFEFSSDVISQTIVLI